MKTKKKAYEYRKDYTGLEYERVNHSYSPPYIVEISINILSNIPFRFLVFYSNSPDITLIRLTKIGLLIFLKSGHTMRNENPLVQKVIRPLYDKF